MTTTTAQTQYEGLDLSYLHTISGGDTAFEKDMMQSLLSEMGEKMTALSTAILQNDVKNVRMNAHSLKNLAGIIGVGTLTEHFKTIEHTCEDVPNSLTLQHFMPCEGQWAHSKALIVQWLATC